MIDLKQLEPQLLALRASVAKEGAEFPPGGDWRMARLVEEKLHLPLQSGLFVDNAGRGHPHAWNVEPDTGDIVDLSLVQFNPTSRPIEISQPRDIEESRYLAGVYFAA